MKKILLTLTFLLVVVLGVKAQERTVTGKITSEEDALGLPGVSIMIKGTLTGTVTNIEGDFVLSGVVDNDTLAVTYLGYAPQEILVGSQKVINVVMQVSVNELGEVVVTALGVKRQQREIGYSTQKMDVDLIVQSNTPNVIDAIVGRSAGVQVSQGDGVDGGSTRITIRGNNNLSGNNQPLIVVDNVPMENTSGLENIGRGTDWGNPIGDINPLDIEDYTVLKGGAASALYGSRGANGVILITTKRGKKGKGIGLTYNFSQKMIQPYRFREVQNTYGFGGPVSFTPPTFPMNGDTALLPNYGNGNLIIDQQGGTSSTTAEFGYYGSAVSWGPKMEGQMVKWWDGEMRPYSPQPDNYKSNFHTGTTQTHNIAASGSGDVGTMRVSITRQDHKAIINNSDFDRTTINLGTNLKISDKVRAYLSLTYTNYYRLNSPILGDDYNSFNKGYLYSWPRSYKGLEKENYAYADGSQNPQEGYPYNDINPNLWWNYYNNNTTLKRDNYLGGLTLTYDITSWLNFAGRVGRDFTLEQSETRNKPIDVIGLRDGYYGKSMSRTYSDIFEAFLTGEKSNILNSKISTKVMVGASRWDYDYYTLSGHSGTWYYPNMYMFGNYTETTYTTDEYGNTIVDRPGNTASEMVAGEGIRRERTNSVFSFVNFSYDNYLFVEFTGRNDWSSTLPAYSNSFFYPSVSVSFIASEAFHIQDKTSWLNFVKLRGGIAQTASGTDTPYMTDFYYSTGNFGGVQTTYFPGSIPPFNLTPKWVDAYEGGLNLGFFENRIDFDFTYYYSYSYSQILPGLPIPSSSGSSYITINEGTLSNKGFEIVLNAVPIQTPTILFKTGINLSRNRNHIISLGENAEVFPLADIWGLNGLAMALREGDEYGTIYGYDYIYNENGQRVVNDEGTKYLTTDTRVAIGNASPDFIGGWYTELYYKGFRLGTLIDTKWGGDIYSGSYVIGLQSGQSPETLIEREGGGLPYTDPAGNMSNIGIILDGVHEDGTPNDKVVHYYYKYLPNAGGWGKFLSTPGIVENTWVKMREISLSYSFPQKFINKTKVFQNLKLSIVGRDLFYIYTTLPDKINPEGIMGSGNAQGFEWASMPGSRSITFGINASF
ncbi:MAG: SusC/RagA family TonB-linked outer membrane protein [Bacteroidetes bacterium]|nr:SusC/RagA family TonB-linked outer membrane protein [Bacteroidota bacterium]